MKKYGLIGYPLGHSFSPTYFNNKFKKEGIKDCTYQAFPLEKIEDFLVLLKQEPQLVGLNVTIPYKESIIPYLDELSPVAQEIKAVNTIIFKNGKLIGDNTDVYGFEKSLSMFYPKVNQHKLALILGSGGASKAVQYVLRKLGIPYQIVSRRKAKKHINYHETTKKIISECSLIINTTPLGMAPQLDTCPKLRYRFLNEQHYLYDLVYNPKKTLFLKKGEDQSSPIKSGGDMLIYQAEKSWELWNQ